MIITEEIPQALDGERLDRVVALITGWSRSAVKPLLESSVLVDGVPPAGRVARVSTGNVVTIDLPDVEAEAPPSASAEVLVPVVYEDDDLIVVDKPAGLVVHPGAGHLDDTLVNGLLATHPDIASVGDVSRPGIVHRLDRDTTGLLVVARNEDAYDSLVSALAARTVSRVYEAICLGTTDTPRGVVDAPIGRSRRARVRMAVSNEGREARTQYLVRRQYHDPIESTWFRCQLETGRTHQIRVHLAAIGTPVMGDDLYGRPDAFNVDRQQLHAAMLEFEHPRTGSTMTFSSEIPDDMASTLRMLGEQDPTVPSNEV
jgi:23S rRNA pseudouridine1911/1915/1917 synthase